MPAARKTSRTRAARNTPTKAPAPPRSRAQAARDRENAKREARHEPEPGAARQDAEAIAVGRALLEQHRELEERVRRIEMQPPAVHVMGGGTASGFTMNSVEASAKEPSTRDGDGEDEYEASPRIAMHHDALRESILFLGESLSVLEKRLDPIVRPEPDLDQPRAERAVPIQSPLSDSIEQRTLEVDQAHARVRRLLDRLEL